MQSNIQKDENKNANPNNLEQEQPNTLKDENANPNNL
jgi:hypothetical protein